MCSGDGCKHLCDKFPEIASPESPDTVSLLPLAKKHKAIKDRIKPRSDALVSIIMLSWHPTKNGDIDPKFVSGDVLVWWICTEKGNCLDTCTHEHEWQAIIHNRFSKDGEPKQGCSFCNGNWKFCPCESFEARMPELASQWHPTLNGSLLPSQFSVGSKQVIFWRCLYTSRHSRNSQCVEGCTEEHIYEAAIYSRVAGRGCSFCSSGGKSICLCRSLEARFPELAREWDYSKNALSPKDYFYSSNKMVNWICPDPKCKHQYPALISNRTRKNPSACPKCNLNRWEARLLEIQKSYGSMIVHGKPSIKCFDQINGKWRQLTPDSIGHIVSNGHRFMIEFDGEQHFKSAKFNGSWSDFRDQICRDLAKNKYARDNGMSLLRVAWTDRYHMESWIREFLDYCTSTPIPTTRFSNPESYKKTWRVIAM